MSAGTEIETPRLLLCGWGEDYLDAYARICEDPEVMRYLPGILTREQSEEQISKFVRHWKERGFGLWATEVRATGTFIGFIGLQYSEDWPEGEHKTEVGWRLDHSYWGRGPLPRARWRASATDSRSLGWSALSASRSRRTWPHVA